MSFSFTTNPAKKAKTGWVKSLKVIFLMIVTFLTSSVLSKGHQPKHGSSDGRAAELESGVPGFESYRF